MGVCIACRRITRTLSLREELNNKSERELAGAWGIARDALNQQFSQFPNSGLLKERKFSPETQATHVERRARLRAAKYAHWLHDKC